MRVAAQIFTRDVIFSYEIFVEDSNAKGCFAKILSAFSIIRRFASGNGLKTSKIQAKEAKNEL